MKAQSVTFERTFFLGNAPGPTQFPESFRVSIAWSLENETPEEAEEKAMAKLYEMAERERKRRYRKIKQWTDERSHEENNKASANAVDAVRKHVDAQRPLTVKELALAGAKGTNA